MTISEFTQKRLLGEVKKLKKEKMDYVQAFQDENNQLIFYFLFVGQKDSHYEGGYYLGKIILPKTFPDKAPDYMMLTPNGRFEYDKNICLTISGYHNDTWTPTWTIVKIVEAFYSIFNSDDDTGISHITFAKNTAQSTKDRIINSRKIFALESISYNQQYYFDIFTKFKQFINITGFPYSKTEIENIKNDKKLKKIKKKIDENNIETDIETNNDKLIDNHNEFLTDNNLINNIIETNADTTSNDILANNNLIEKHNEIVTNNNLIDNIIETNTDTTSNDILANNIIEPINNILIEKHNEIVTNNNLIDNIIETNTDTTSNDKLINNNIEPNNNILSDNIELNNDNNKKLFNKIKKMTIKNFNKKIFIDLNKIKTNKINL
jgi:ubiquitin-protein ligase